MGKNNANETKKQTEPDGTPAQSKWAKTKVANLYRYVPSGKYFARVRIGDKVHFKSLKTDVFTVAQQRLPDLKKELRGETDGEKRVANGKMTFGDARAIYEARLEANNGITKGAKVYRRKCIETLFANWEGLEKTDVRKVSINECLDWAKGLAEKYSPSVYNNTVDTLRGILNIAIKSGARYGNPAMEIAKRKPTVKKLTLPTREKFDELVLSIENAGGRFSQDCADLVRFLAFGGFRKTEAAGVQWGFCDFTKGQIYLPPEITKNHEPRYVPMIDKMRELLKRLRTERPDEPVTGLVMRVNECQKAIENHAKKIGMERITHHDLRHLFATRCIEAGVDIPTVSRWLGHKDGGALAMKVYGHLCDEHSAEMAKRVNF